jgi:hypothetical protein
MADQPSNSTAVNTAWLNSTRSWLWLGLLQKWYKCDSNSRHLEDRAIFKFSTLLYLLYLVEIDHAVNTAWSNSTNT